MQFCYLLKTIFLSNEGQTIGESSGLSDVLFSIVVIIKDKFMRNPAFIYPVAQLTEFQRNVSRYRVHSNVTCLQWKLAFRLSFNITLFIVGVDGVKDALFARLKLMEPGPGFVHFSRDRDVEYFRQLTSERVVTRFEKGRPIRSWQPRRQGERNEALDTFVYAMAGLQGLISMGLRLNDEAEAMAAAIRRGDAPMAKTASALSVVRSAWMGEFR